MTKGVKHPSPLRIDMSADEALERFIATDPKEVDALIEQSKQKAPLGGKKKRKPSGEASQSENVVNLRKRRMRKKNEGR